MNRHTSPGGRIAQIYLILVGYSILCWVINLVKLLLVFTAMPEQVELSKHFVLHLAGLIPPVAWVTAWM